MVKTNFTELRKSALLAADWYVNSQIVQKKPHWDANHGRFIYNYHCPSRSLVRGIGWTQARGIMVLMAAHRISGKARYRDAAQQAISYLKSLQIYDPALPYCGAFAEDTPQSRYCYPRDGAEAGSGFLHLYHECGDRDLVRRARLYGDFLLSIMEKKSGLPYGRYDFNTLEKKFMGKAFLVGCGMFYSLLYQATGERKYLTQGLKPLVANVEKKFMAPDGALIDTHFDAHHTEPGAGRKVINNCDGLSAANLAYGLHFKDSRALENGVRIADWMVTQTQKMHSFCSLPSRLVYLMDVFRLTGNPKYRDYVLSRVGEVLTLQVRSGKDPFSLGAFRGEDEPPEWYLKGATGKEFVTNRTTAYSALLLFKIINEDWTPAYSAYGWKRKPVRS